MKEFDGLQSWIHKKKKEDPDWELSDATYNFIIGLEGDLEHLACILGVDLCIMTIRHVQD